MRVTTKIEGSLEEVSGALGLEHFGQLPKDGIVTFKGGKYRATDVSATRWCYGQESAEVVMEEICIVKSQEEVLAERLVECAREALESAEKHLNTIKEKSK